MALSIVEPTTEEMLACVARASDVQGTNDGFLDRDLPGCDRWICNYLGAVNSEPGSPTGETALPAISHLQPGFGIAFVKASPGNGVPSHVHDTNETFMVLEGRWRVFWEGNQGTESVDLAKYDLISISPGIMRRFENLETEPGAEQGILLGVVAGDSPKTEFSRDALEFLVAHGRVSAEQLREFEKEAR